MTLHARKWVGSAQKIKRNPEIGAQKYKARNIKSEELCAIKKLEKNNSDQRKLQNEVEILRRAKHINITQLIDVHETEKYVFIIGF